MNIIASQVRNILGIPNTDPDAYDVKLWGRLDIVLAPVINRITFLTTVMDAIVAMNGGTFALCTRTPLNNPTNILAPMAMRIDTMTGIPLTMHMETTIPDKPTTEPTDKSIPDDVMTKVIPIAIIPYMEACFNSFISVSTFKNTGDFTPKNKNKANKIPTNSSSV